MLTRTRMLGESASWPLRISGIAAMIGACTFASSSASAQSRPAAAAAPAEASPSPGQKPPCVPATSYTLGYDCELFPLPGLSGSPAGDAVTPAAAAAAATPIAAAAATAPSSSSSSSSSSGPSHAPAYVAFVLGAGGAGVGVTFGILALKNKSTLSAECSSENNCPASASSTVSALKLDGILADVGVGVAVVGVTLGAILFATERGPSTSSGMRHVQPWLGLGAGGLRGTF